MKHLFLMTMITFGAVWAIDSGTGGSNGAASGAFSVVSPRDTVDLKINPMVTIDNLASSENTWLFGAPGDLTTNITLTTTSNTALKVTFEASHGATTTDDVVLVFSDNTSSGTGAFEAVDASNPAAETPDRSASATKLIAFGDAAQVTGVTLTGTYGAVPANQDGHTITVTATLTDDGDA